MNVMTQAIPTRRGLAITALVLGIIAALCAIVPVLGIILGLGAIVFGAVGLRRRQSKGMSVTGIVLGALATLASTVATVMFFAFAGWFLSAVEADPTTSGDERVVVEERQNDTPGPWSMGMSRWPRPKATVWSRSGKAKTPSTR